jgi:integrase
VAVVDAAGKMHRQSVYAATEREAKRRLREVIAQRETGIIAPGARETMALFLTSWLEGVKPTLRPRSWDRYEEHVRLHLIPTLGRIPLTRLSPMDVQRANSDLLKMGLAPATVCRAHATLRAALKQALRWQLIPSNPASLVTPPRVEHREMAAMDPDQTRRFLHSARATPLEALWVLAVTTGIRQGELLALKWSEVDLEGASVRVIGTLTRIDVEPLFCSQYCRQAAEVVRYVRGCRRDGRDQLEDVREAIRMRLAMVLGGGYPERQRVVSAETRAEVFRRVGGCCEQCGRMLDFERSTGDRDAIATIQHVHGDSNELENLQAFCRRCNIDDARSKFVPLQAGTDEARMAAELERRWSAVEPQRLCDDDLEWKTSWQRLTKAARDWLRKEAGA